MIKIKKPKKPINNGEVLYIFRISPSKLICAKIEEMTNYKMKYGSMADKGKYIHA